MSTSVRSITEKLEERKHRLRPLTKAVNELRQQVCLTSMTHGEMKKMYEKVKLSADCTSAQIRMVSACCCHIIYALYFSSLAHAQ
jgi:hypothetical protein